MVRKIYTEMPHIRVPGTQRSIDIQLEDKTASDVIAFIHDVANGDPVSDKWGRSVEIEDEEGRKAFIRAIGMNPFFQNMLSLFTENERILIRAILSLVE